MRFAILTLAIPLIACGKPADVPARPTPLSVRLAQITSTGAPEVIVTTGTVGWRREVQLGFTSPGRVARVEVSEGDRVATGQLLAALDATTVSASLDSARAERARAVEEMQRSATLLRQGWVTRPRVDNARAALASADANVRAAGFQTRNAVVTATGSGVVLARMVEPGQVVAAGTPVLTMGEVGGGLVVRVPLTEAETNRVRVGAPAEVAFDDGRRLTGRIVQVPGRASTATGTFPVEIVLPASTPVRAGDVARVRLTIGARAAGGLAVPSGALFAARAGAGFVYVFNPRTGRVAARRVLLAETGDDSVRVTGGIEPGELVAVSAIDRLADGMAVTALRPAR